MNFHAPRLPYIEGIERLKKLPPHIKVLIALLTFTCVGALSLTLMLVDVRAFSGGSGTPDDPYLITTCAELQTIDASESNLSGTYLLSNDIDCSSIPNFSPIGDITNPSLGFNGRFDGGGAYHF